MSKQKAIFFLGIWVAILPFLGFPGSWKRTLALISGAVIAYIGYLLNKEKMALHGKHDPHAAYVENSEVRGHESVK
jgi:hypothetical protein